MLRGKMEMAKFLQETTALMMEKAIKEQQLKQSKKSLEKDDKTLSVSEFSLFMDRVRSDKYV